MTTTTPEASRPTKGDTTWLRCYACNKVVSNLRIYTDTIVRAVVLCPECYAKEHDIDLGGKSDEN